MKTPFHFMVIDDNPVNNMLCGIFIKDAAGEAEIEDFTIPEKGLDYIVQRYSGNRIPTILFLDINMPTMSGWEFLDKFERLDENIKEQFKIYMMSSSIDSADKQKASDHKSVVDYIEKPLSEETVLFILEAQKKIA